MQTRTDVAIALGVREKWLCYVLYGAKERCNYSLFEIPKRRGGTRIISCPPRRLRWLQSRVLGLLQDLYKPKACVHGFAQSRSIRTNAAPHAARRFIVNFDLENFFPSIHIGRVIGVLQSTPFNFGSEAAKVLAQICCDADARLPQGGVTSPLISNLVCWGLDSDLLSFAQKNRLRYSRYADDITFSSLKPIVPPELLDASTGQLVPSTQFKEIIERHSFALNTAKLKYRTRSRRQEVTGLTVNQFPNVTREYIRNISGALFVWRRHGYELAKAKFLEKFRSGKGTELSNVIRGRLAFVKMVRGQDDFIFRRLSREFNRLIGNGPPIAVPPIVSAVPCPMHNLPCAWNRWIEKYKSQVFHLLCSNASGDETGGSAFHIGSGLVVTARHNVFDDDGAKRPGLCLRIGNCRTGVHIVQCKLATESYADVACVRLLEKTEDRGIPTQLRLPEIGEEVVAIGFPAIPQRNPTMVVHTGTIEALPVTYDNKLRFIQVSFPSGGGLSGGCLLDRSGHVLGVMVENVFMGASFDGVQSFGSATTPQRAYGQAVPIEYVDDYLHGF